MKSSTRLDSAIFQLTPTRTRYDLIITANGKTEKIASGLLNPFLAHLKTAQDQIAKGGYSILLQPEPGSGATWFTKGTVEMFVRFVSTPEILERVYTIESEILQIEEAISIQGNSHMGLSTVEDCQAKPVGSSEGSKPMTDGNEEKAIVLYKSDVHPPEANGSIAQEGNSKVQLLKVLETRKTVLQKEQGMAFARAVAAGFDIDHMTPLVSFAECFGASRLIDACLRFIDLWKGKHETGQWLEIEAAEAMTNRSGFSAMDASGIMPSSVANKQNESRGDSASENNRKEGIDSSADEKHPMDHQVPVGQQQYIQGPFPHPMFPPWPVHSPPGTLPVYQPYPVQGIPYYPNYLGNGPFYQSPYPPMEDSRFNVGHRAGQKRHSMDSIDSNIESEQGDLELEKEASQSRGPRKRGGRSDKKRSGMVVIRNINYVTSKGKNSSGSESQSASDSDTDNEAVDLHKSSLSLKRKGGQAKSMDESNSHDKEDTSYGKETDGGHWQAFQNFLLRDADEHNHAANQGMFSPKQRQTLLFSATVPKEVRQICHIALKREHEFIDTVGDDSEQTHSQVRQMHLVAPLDKHFPVLYVKLKEHISDDADYKVLVFCTTAMVTRLVADLLGQLNLNVREIHSRKPQSYRTRISDEFRKSKGLILVTSDVSARGVDYPDVTLVIQVGLPSDREQYIHRLGRTGRKGKEGQGILLLAPWEESFLSSVKDLPITKAPAPSVDPESQKKVERALAQVEMKNKEAAYQAWLGYYNSTKIVGRDKHRLVELVNEFSRSMGLNNPPAIPKLVLGKMGLRNIPGLRSK